MTFRGLRFFLLLNAAFLFGIGIFLIFSPDRLSEVALLPSGSPEIHYLLAMWGGVLVTLSMGYFWTATDPVRNVIWIQMAIARGFVEFMVGAYYIGTNILTVRQAGLGSGAGLVVALTYLLLYPRKLPQNSALSQG